MSKEQQVIDQEILEPLKKEAIQKVAHSQEDF